MISSADFTRPSSGLGAVGTAQPTRGGDPHPGTGRERSRSCRADPLAISVQFCWPSALRELGNLAVCVQDLVAADTQILTLITETPTPRLAISNRATRPASVRTH